MANFDFNSLVSASKQVDLTSAYEEANAKPEYGRDERYFQIQQKDGVARATVRFLPHMQGKIPFVKFQDRFVTVDKASKKYFVNRDRITIGDEEDPAQLFYRKAWDKFEATGNEKWKKIGQMMRRKDKFISMINVLHNPFDTAEESISGLNFLYEYGNELFGIIQDARKTVDDFGMPLTATDVFDLQDGGGDFGLLRKKEDEKSFPRYINSKVVRHGAFLDGDAAQIKNWQQVNADRWWDIYDEVAEGKFPTREQVHKDLEKAWGDVYLELFGKQPSSAGSVTTGASASAGDDILDMLDEKPNVEKTSSTAGAKTQAPKDDGATVEADKAPSTPSDDDDLAAFFS